MLTLILGGARSGKSDMAQRLAAGSGRPVLFVATMEGRDEEVAHRIAAHRASRPAGWRTVEAPMDVAGALEARARAGDFVVLDCITMWVTNMLLARWPDVDALPPAEADAGVSEIVDAVARFAGWASVFDGEVVAVSNEVGMGVVPPYPLGRLFRDALGAANAAVAARAGRAYLLVAGLALELKSLGAVPLDGTGTPPAP